MASNPKKDPFGPWLNGFTYDKAFNGETWQLTKGDDFDQASSTIVAKLREEAHRRHGHLEVRADGDNVFVRWEAPTSS